MDITKEKREFETVPEEHENITLSREDWLFFLNALENPPEPNDRLKEAMRDMQRTTNGFA